MTFSHNDTEILLFFFLKFIEELKDAVKIKEFLDIFLEKIRNCCF